MKRLGLIALVLLLSSLAQAAEVAPLRWGARSAIGATVITDRAMDIASGADLIFSGEFVLSVAPSRKLRGLDLELGWTGMGSSTTVFQTYRGALSTQSLVVGARYRQPLFRWLNLYGRVGATLDWTSLTLSESTSTQVLSDTAFTSGALGAVGAEWNLHLTDESDQPRMGLGLYIELGYVRRFAQAHFNELRPEGAAPSEPERIAFTPVDVGSMNLSAPYWRLGGVLRF